LTKVISILKEVPRLTCLGWQEASTQAKIYLNSMLIAIPHIYISAFGNTIFPALLFNGLDHEIEFKYFDKSG
jgi:hypothetical protein